jgi:hypothetical protein
MTMTPRTKLIVTVALLVFLGGVGAADYFLSGSDTTADVLSGSSSSSSVSSTSQNGRVMVNNGPDVNTFIASQGFTTEQSTELNFLSQVAGSSTSVHGLSILKDNDRVGSVTWIETPEVKNIFIALKEALLSAFSAKLQGLQDQTMQSANAPVRNELSFFDPALSSEKLAFVRVRERLYEFHIANGQEDTMNGLIDALTTK